MFLAGPRDVNEVFMLVKDNIDFYPLFVKAVGLIATHTRTPENLNRLIDRIEGLPQTERTTAEYRDWLESELNGIQAELTAAIDPAPVPAPVPARRRAVSSRQQAIDAMEEEEANTHDAEFDEPALESDEPALESDEPATGLETLIAVATAAAAASITDATIPVPSPAAVELASNPATRKRPRVTLIDPLAASLAPADTPADEPTVPTSPATSTSPTASTEGQLGPSGNSTTRVTFGAAVTSPKLTKRRKSTTALARAAALSAVTSTPAPAPTARTPVTPVTAPSAPAARTPVTPVTAPPALVASPVAARASLKRTAAAAVPVEASSASSKRVRTVHAPDEEGDEGEAPARAPVRAPMTAAEIAARENQQYVAKATSQAHAAVFEDFLFLHGLHRESQKPKYRLARRNEPKEDLDKAQPKAPPVPTDPAIFTKHFVLFPPTNCKREVMRDRKVPELYVSIYLQRAGTKAWRYYFTHSARSDSSPAMCMQLEANPDHMACMVWGGVDQLSASSRAEQRYRVLQLAQIIDFLVLAKPYRAEGGRGSLPSFDGIGRLQFSQSDTQLEPFLVDVVNAQVEIAVFDKAADGWCIGVSVANARRLYERYRVMCTEGKKSEYIVCIYILIILCIYYYMQETQGSLIQTSRAVTMPSYRKQAVRARRRRRPPLPHRPSPPLARRPGLPPLPDPRLPLSPRPPPLQSLAVV